MSPQPTHRRSRVTALYVSGFLLALPQQGVAAELPAVHELLLETPFSAKHTRQVIAGKISTTDIVPVSANELAQGVACLIKKDATKDLEAIRTGTWLAPDQHILLSSLIPDSGTLADFKDVHFNYQQQDELQRFINAEAGKELNLSLLEIDQFSQFKGKENQRLHQKNAEKLIQSILLNRYQKYRKLGAVGIDPYARSDSQQTQPGQQLITSLEESLGIKTNYPQLYHLIKQYPHSVNMPVTETYYWYLVNLGDRPAIGLSHRIHSNIDDATFIVERGYYISHTIDSVQVMIGLIPVQEGTLLIYTNRTWTEKISGLFSKIKRKIAYNIMISEMKHVMKKIHVCKKES